MSPSIEGAFLVSSVEYVSKATLYLLRAETTQHDPYGFTGTTVATFSRFNEPAEIVCRGFQTPAPTAVQ
jgi:hypothetical protein